MESTTRNEGSDEGGVTRTLQQWAAAQDEYSRLYQSLAAGQAEAYSRASQRLMDAQKDYMSNLSNLNEELIGRYREAHATLASRMRDAMPKAPTEQGEDAYAGLGQALVAVQEEFRTRAEQFYSDLTSAAEQAERDYQFYNRSAYRKYLEDQRNFWTKLNVESLIPND